MAGEDAIKYSDIIKPDSSITDLITQLKAAGASFSELSELIRNGASTVAQSVNKMSGATKEGRLNINAAALAADALEVAYKNAGVAMSDVGKLIQELNVLTTTANKQNRQHIQYIQAAAGSYDKINLEMQDYIRLYKSLSAEERTSVEMGGQILAQIKALGAQLKAINAELKPHVQQLTAAQKAEQQLAYYRSEEGKQLLTMRAYMREYTKEFNNQLKAASAASGSYDQIKANLDALRATYKALSEEQRNDALIGGELLNSIQLYQTQLKQMDAAMKGQTQTTDELTKAKQKLAFVQSDEGKELARVREQIKQVNKGYANEAREVNKVVEAKEKLRYAQSDERIELASLTQQTKEANRVAELTAQVNRSAEGSYNRIAAQYELNKIELNNMSYAQRTGTETGRALEQETRNLYATMIKLQEATGKYNLSVGNYSKAFNGLGFSVAQVVRELPAAAVGLNTFFLAISNNIPMLVDQINMAKAHNAEIRRMNAEVSKIGGTLTKVIPVGTQVLRSLLSWNTALVVILTLLSTFGKEFGQFIKQLFTGEGALIRFNKALKNVQKSLKENDQGFGEQMVLLRNLQYEYSKLSTEMQKTQFLKDTADEFERLGVSVQSVADAEDVLIKNTDNVIDSLRQRSHAAAVQALAAEEYGKAMPYMQELVNLEAGVFSKDALKAIGNRFQSMIGAGYLSPEDIAAMGGTDVLYKQAIAEYVEERSEELRKTIDQYFKNAEQYFMLEPGADFSNKDKTGGGSTTIIDFENRGRDPWEYIQNMRIAVTKKNEEAITAIIVDEYAKREKAARSSYEVELMELQKYYDKNERILTDDIGMFRELTAEEKKAIGQAQYNLMQAQGDDNAYRKARKEYFKIYNEIMEDALNEGKGLYRKLNKDEIQILEQYQDVIRETMVNAEAALNKELADLAREKQIYLLQIEEAGIQERLKAVKEGSEEELNLRKRSRTIQQEVALIQNAALPAEYQRSEEDIRNATAVELDQLDRDYQLQRLNEEQAAVNLQLETLIKGTEEELRARLELNEIQRQIALLQNLDNLGNPIQSTQGINAKYNQNAALMMGTFSNAELERNVSEYEAIMSRRNRTQRQAAEAEIRVEEWRLDEMLRLAMAGQKIMTPNDWQDYFNRRGNVEAKKKQTTGITGFANTVVDQGGVLGAIYDYMGFDQDGIDAMNAATDQILSNLQDIMDAYVEVAEAAVEAANARVEAAQSALDAELEARANGYANSVATMQAELQAEKKMQAEKQRELEKAQRAQEAINSALQASSLITATAQIIAAYSSMPFVGQALSLVAIAAMWATFAAAKIKAAQVTAVSEYGEGGYEVLQGGSHASGHDIDLGTTNKKGRRMHAEGGEALAIINKRRTAQYGKILPDIVDSLNKGTFEEKYMRALDATGALSVVLAGQKGADLSTIEHDLRELKNSAMSRTYLLPDGRLVIETKNTKRIIKS